ncbi:MAG: hypothetical protein ABIH03_02395, partial [Pseudomonadota bacterium]
MPVLRFIAALVFTAFSWGCTTAPVQLRGSTALPTTTESSPDFTVQTAAKAAKAKSDAIPGLTAGSAAVAAAPSPSSVEVKDSLRGI